MKEIYRPDIDGLRAIAVLSVIFYHFTPKLLSGGFIGVDIFFVISGYLITRNISKEFEIGKFSFKSFYLRRIRRLMPALFFVLFITLIAGFLFFPPSHYEKLGSSLFYTIFSLSNFYFWAQTNYFDIQSNLKPLLHTWSLSVEEQFYLIWPFLLFLVLSSKKKIYIFILIIICFLSLFFSQKLLSSNQETVFFLMPFRITEFALGAMALIFENKIKNFKSYFKDALFIFGLILIIYSLININEFSLFPGYLSLLPTFGAMLVILFGDSIFSKYLLGNKVLVKIGLISYSLYLVHWPLYVFYGYLKFDYLNHLDISILLVTTFVISYFIYVFIEKPFRLNEYRIYQWLKDKTIQTFSISALILLFFSTLVWGNNGLKLRFDSNIIELTESIDEDFINRKFYLASNRCVIKDSMSAENYWSCLNKLSNQNVKVLIVGDSHGRDFFNALSFAYGAENFDFIQQPSCNAYPYKHVRNFYCFRDLKNFFKNNSNNKQYSHVIFSSHWGGDKIEISKNALEIINLAKSLDIVPLFVGNTPRFTQPIPDLIFRFKKIDGLDSYINGFLDNDNYEKSVYLKKFMKKYDIKFIDKHEILCPKNMCTSIIGNNKRSIFFDDAHWTISGAQYFAKKLKQKYKNLKIFLN